MLYSSYRKQSISNIRNAKFVAFFLVQKTVCFFCKYSQDEVWWSRASPPRTQSIPLHPEHTPFQTFTGISLTVFYSYRIQSFSVLFRVQNTILFKRSQAAVWKSLTRTEHSLIHLFTGRSLMVSSSYRTLSFSKTSTLTTGSSLVTLPSSCCSFCSSSRSCHSSRCPQQTVHLPMKQNEQKEKKKRGKTQAFKHPPSPFSFPLSAFKVYVYDNRGDCKQIWFPP